MRLLHERLVLIKDDGNVTMCTPVGHTILGLSVLDWHKEDGWSGKWLLILLIIIAASLPDIDFLFGWIRGNPNLHHQEMTHSLLFAAVMLGVLWGGSRPLFRKFHLPGFQILALAIGSHLLLDLLGNDTRPPVGIPLFWPFSEVRITSPVSIFPSVYKSSESGTFIQSLLCRHNLKVVCVEAGIIGGLYVLFRMVRRRPCM